MQIVQCEGEVVYTHTPEGSRKNVMHVCFRYFTNYPVNKVNGKAFSVIETWTSGQRVVLQSVRGCMCAYREQKGLCHHHHRHPGGSRRSADRRWWLFEAVPYGYRSRDSKGLQGKYRQQASGSRS